MASDDLAKRLQALSIINEALKSENEEVRTRRLLVLERRVLTFSTACAAAAPVARGWRRRPGGAGRIGGARR